MSIKVIKPYILHSTPNGDREFNLTVADLLAFLQGSDPTDTVHIDGNGLDALIRILPNFDRLVEEASLESDE
jgi:hypothetical protein